jgi:hypothetical protein
VAAVAALIFAMAPAAVAVPDEFGGGAYVAPYAPYTAGPVVSEQAARPYAPYEAGPVIHKSDRPYAPYTAGPVVADATEPYAPYEAGPVIHASDLQ